MLSDPQGECVGNGLAEIDGNLLISMRSLLKIRSRVLVDALTIEPVDARDQTTFLAIFLDIILSTVPW